MASPALDQMLFQNLPVWDSDPPKHNPPSLQQPKTTPDMFVELYMKGLDSFELQQGAEG